MHNTRRSSTCASARRLRRLGTGPWSWRIKSSDTLADPRFQIHCGPDRLRENGHQMIVSFLSGITTKTRHRASTSMYSLTFCIRFLLPECHQWKPAVQTAAVMLRTPPSTANHRRASHAHFAYTARNFENAPRHLPVSGQQRVQTPPSRPFTLCCHIEGWTQASNKGSRYVAIAMQPVP